MQLAQLPVECKRMFRGGSMVQSDGLMDMTLSSVIIYAERKSNSHCKFVEKSKWMHMCNE